MTCFSQWNVSISNLCHFWVEAIKAVLIFAISLSVCHGNQHHSKRCSQMLASPSAFILERRQCEAEPPANSQWTCDMSGKWPYVVSSCWVLGVPCSFCYTVVLHHSLLRLITCICTIFFVLHSFLHLSPFICLDFAFTYNISFRISFRVNLCWWTLSFCLNVVLFALIL